MAPATASVYALIRLLTCGVWVFAGLYKAFHYEETVADMRQHRLPLASYLLALVITMELAGSVLLFSNTQVWVVALVWIAFTVLASMIYHWPIQVNGSIVFTQLVQFSKNLSIIGGLLALLLLDPGKPAWLRALVTG